MHAAIKTSWACFAQQPFAVFTIPVFKVLPSYFSNRFAVDIAYEAGFFEPQESILGILKHLTVLLRELCIDFILAF